MKTASQLGGYFTTDEIWVELDPKTGANNDGWAFVYNAYDLLPANLMDSIDINGFSFNGVLYAQDTVHLRGTLDGELTIATGSDIYLDDDVIYERSPVMGDPTATDDLLGLVAEKNVYIADNPANHDDISIHATIFTRTGSFTAENYDTRPVSGYINLIGGIVQDTRGPVGTGKFTGGKVVIESGFYKRYYFDERLSDNLFRPPSFPGFWTRTLRIAGWWE